MTGSLAADKDFSVDVAVQAVLSELDRVFTLKEEQRRGLKAFCRRKYVFALLLTGFAKSCLPS